MESLRTLGLGLLFLLAMVTPVVGLILLTMWLPWVGGTIMVLLALGMLGLLALVLGEDVRRWLRE